MASILLLHKFHVCGHFGSLGRSMTVPRHISWHGFLDSSPIPLLPGHAAFPPRRRAQLFGAPEAVEIAPVLAVNFYDFRWETD